MAWRAIQSTVGMSESLAAVGHLAERIYWRLLAHTDMWGRLDAKPRKLRALCYPMLTSITDQFAGSALIELITVGRIIVYTKGDLLIIQVADFEENQPREAFRKRSGESKFPPPPAKPVPAPELIVEAYGITLLAGDSGNDPEADRRAVRNGSGPEETETENETTSTTGTLAAVGWNERQMEEAKVVDLARACAWVEHAKAQPGVRSPGAVAWTGFKTGGWPVVEKERVEAPAYARPDVVCSDCGETLGAGHLEDCPRMAKAAPVQEEVPA